MMTDQQMIQALKEQCKDLEEHVRDLQKVRRAALAVRFDYTEAKGKDLDILLSEESEKWEKKRGRY